MKGIESVDDVLDVNRKLLKVLSGRLASKDVVEAFYDQEFFYVSSFVSPDQIITCELDSAFVACSFMLPNYYLYTGLPADPTARVVQLETLSSARGLVQGSLADNSQSGFGMPQTCFSPQITAATVFDLNAQYFFEEPWLLAPGTVLRASFVNPLTLARAGFSYQDVWVLGGYKVSLT